MHQHLHSPSPGDAIARRRPNCGPTSACLLFLIGATAARFAFHEPAHRCFAAESDTSWVPPNPIPRPLLSETLVVEWDAALIDRHWKPAGDLRASTSQDEPSTAKYQSVGVDPMLISPKFAARGPLRVDLRFRSNIPGEGQLFWQVRGAPGFSESHSVRFNVTANGDAESQSVELPASGQVVSLRFDPGSGTGAVQVDRVSVTQLEHHPLELDRLSVSDTTIELTLQNHGEADRRASVSGRTVDGMSTEVDIPAGQHRVVRILREQPLAPYISQRVVVKSAGLPDLTRTLHLANPAAPDDAISLTPRDENLAELQLRVARDGSGARLVRGQSVVATLFPLAIGESGEPVSLNVQKVGDSLQAVGNGVELAFRWDQGDLRIDLNSPNQTIEGPVIRTVGQLEQGLFPGIEHLGRGERSSSSLDVRTPEHVRFRPDRFWVTQPMCATLTDQGSIAVAWNDPQIVPTFASPNFFDGQPDHRMSTTGRKMSLRVRIAGPFSDTERLESAILWFVNQQGGFPAVAPVRTAAEQQQLNLAGFDRSLIHGGDSTWHHAGLPGGKMLPEKPHTFADLASARFRLTGQLPPAEKLVRGGGHVANDTVFLLSGRTKDWLAQVTAAARNALARQQSDGSFRYDGEFQKGHFENTTSGQCGLGALPLMLHAKYTGNAESLAAGLRTLEFVKRFRTPRGASVWECPLHAPDLLASAHLVRCYVIAYELTGRPEYRELAVRWALSGVPFVYLWGERPVMKYAVIGTLCATHYTAPLWIGRPVQWMGLVYADALLDLAPHDSTCDWRQLAEGILTAGEQMQYASGPSIGCLPDSWICRTQQAFPYDINPSGLVGLRRRLNGQLDGVEVARFQSRVVVSPFPTMADDQGVSVRAESVSRFQLLFDGRHVVDVNVPSDPTAGAIRVPWPK